MSNRNIEDYLGRIRPQSTKQSTKMYFEHKNLLLNIEQPKGTILQFLERQTKPPKQTNIRDAVSNKKTIDVVEKE